MNYVKDSIGWADYSWNPFTGCKRGCTYCYARKIWNRFHEKRIGYKFDKILYHPERIDELMWLRRKAGKYKIFVGSMSDIEYWPKIETVDLLNEVWWCKKDTFMFLTKNAESYLNYKFPFNCMNGVTIETPGNTISWQQIELVSKQDHPFISIEPIMGGLWKELPESIELVIVGAETGNRKGRVIPQKDWIQSIKDHVPTEKIFWKNNIQRYL